MTDFRKGYHFRHWHIPEEKLAGIERYVEHGCPPGSFLEAVICNDLKAACSRADTDSAINLAAYVAYFYNEAPLACWGSRQKLRAWIRQGGSLRRHTEATTDDNE